MLQPSILLTPRLAHLTSRPSLSACSDAVRKCESTPENIMPLGPSGSENLNKLQTSLSLGSQPTRSRLWTIDLQFNLGEHRQTISTRCATFFKVAFIGLIGAAADLSPRTLVFPPRGTDTPQCLGVHDTNVRHSLRVADQHHADPTLELLKRSNDQFGEH